VVDDRERQGPSDWGPQTHRWDDHHQQRTQISADPYLRISSARARFERYRRLCECYRPCLGRHGRLRLRPDCRGGTSGLVFATPVLIIVQVFSAIILFAFWRVALRSSAGPPGRLIKSGRVIGQILLAAGVALTLVVFVFQISIDAREHAVTFVSLRALETFCSIGFAAAVVGVFDTFTSLDQLGK
jgi:hypothetical protein